MALPHFLEMVIVGLCVDCDQSVREGALRCADCLEEVTETPDWLGVDAREQAQATPPVPVVERAPRRRVSGPPTAAPKVMWQGACAACGIPISAPRRRRFCGQTCYQWALRNPGRTRANLKCRRCGVDICIPKRDWCSKTCQDIARGMRRDPSVPPPPRKVCSESGCDETSRTRGRCKAHYTRWYYGPDGPGDPRSRSGDPERKRARERARTHRRKNISRVGDVSIEYEMALRAKAKRCPLCSVKLIGKPYRPASKELDHIVPLNVGGTHTIGNVRIICRDCNTRRPKDGSDYSGPVTLWAQVG